MNYRCDNCKVLYEDNSLHIVAGKKVFCASCAAQRLEEFESLVQNLGDKTRQILEDDATGDIRQDVAEVCEWFEEADEVINAIQEFAEARIEQTDEDSELEATLETILNFIPHEDKEKGGEGDDEW